MYIPTDLSITGPQLVKLWKGLPVQLTKESLKDSNSRVLLHPMMAKKVESARKRGTGTRLVCCQDEIIKTGPRHMTGNGTMSGTGWFSDAWNWLKQKVPQVYNWAKETVPQVYEDYIKPAIQSDLYQKEIRPKIRSKLEEFAESKPYANVTIPAIEYLGDKTAAFGIKKPKCKKGERSGERSGERGGAIVQQKQKKPTGGSFRPTGY